MEHIVQFGINIDDSAIQKLVIDKAAETVIKEVKKELGVDSRFYDDNVVKNIVRKEVEHQFNEHKDAIIQETARQLVDKLYRTKQVKDRVAQVLDEVMGQ